MVALILMKKREGQILNIDRCEESFALPFISSVDKCVRICAWVFVDKNRLKFVAK